MIEDVIAEAFFIKDESILKIKERRWIATLQLTTLRFSLF